MNNRAAESGREAGRDRAESTPSSALAELSRVQNQQLAGLTQFQAVMESAVEGLARLKEYTHGLQGRISREMDHLAAAGAERRDLCEALERAEAAVRAMFASAGTLAGLNKGCVQELALSAAQSESVCGALNEAVTSWQELDGLVTQLEGVIGTVARVTEDTQRASLKAAEDAGLAQEEAAGFVVIAGEAHKLTLECQKAIDGVRPMIESFRNSLTEAIRSLEDALGLNDSVAEVLGQTGTALSDVAAGSARLQRLLGETQGALGTQYDLENGISQAIDDLQPGILEMAALARSLGLLVRQVHPGWLGTNGLTRQLVETGGSAGVLMDESAGPQAHREPAIRVSLSGPVTTLDPALAVEPASVEVCRQLFARLVEPEGRDFAPSLALFWETADEARTWTFYLRKGARFHDGREITSADVKRSFLRLVSPELQSPLAYLAAPLSGADGRKGAGVEAALGIETPDPYMVVFRLSRPFQPFPGNLAHVGCSIVPSSHPIPPPGPIGQPVVGSGPYRLAGEWGPESVRMEAFQGYFGGLPSVVKIEFTRIVDPGERSDRFREGHLGLMRLTKRHFAEMVTGGQRSLVHTGPCLGTFFAGFNLAKPGPWQDVRFRQALNHAIDRRRMVRDLLGGLALPADGAVPPGFLDGGGAESYPYDPQRAMALLEACGWEPGTREPLEICAPDSGQSLELSEFVAESLIRVGIPAEIRALPWPEAYDSRRLAGCHLYVMAWLAGTSDLDSFLFPLFHSAAGKAGNFGSYSNPQVDRGLVEARTLGPAFRPALYGRIHDIIRCEAPWIFLCHPLHAWAVGPDVDGILIDPYGVPRCEKLWPRKARNRGEGAS